MQLINKNGGIKISSINVADSCKKIRKFINLSFDVDESDNKIVLTIKIKLESSARTIRLISIDNFLPVSILRRHCLGTSGHRFYNAGDSRIAINKDLTPGQTESITLGCSKDQLSYEGIVNAKLRYALNDFNCPPLEFNCLIVLSNKKQQYFIHQITDESVSFRVSLKEIDAETLKITYQILSEIPYEIELIKIINAITSDVENINNPKIDIEEAKAVFMKNNIIFSSAILPKNNICQVEFDVKRITSDKPGLATAILVYKIKNKEFKAKLS